jgi:hypothetical protein
LVRPEPYRPSRLTKMKVPWIALRPVCLAEGGEWRLLAIKRQQTDIANAMSAESSRRWAETAIELRQSVVKLARCLIDKACRLLHVACGALPYVKMEGAGPGVPSHIRQSVFWLVAVGVGVLDFSTSKHSSLQRLS